MCKDKPGQTISKDGKECQSQPQQHAGRDGIEVAAIELYCVLRWEAMEY